LSSLEVLVIYGLNTSSISINKYPRVFGVDMYRIWIRYMIQIEILVLPNSSYINLSKQELSQLLKYKRKRSVDWNPMSVWEHGWFIYIEKK